jgi:hypothetical protein
VWRDEGRPKLTMTMTELQLFLEGSDLVGRMTLSPEAFL